MVRDSIWGRDYWLYSNNICNSVIFLTRTSTKDSKVRKSMFMSIYLSECFAHMLICQWCFLKQQGIMFHFLSSTWKRVGEWSRIYIMLKIFCLKNRIGYSIFTERYNAATGQDMIDINQFGEVVIQLMLWVFLYSPFSFLIKYTSFVYVQLYVFIYVTVLPCVNHEWIYSETYWYWTCRRAERVYV